ncbi:MAG: bifunctional 3-(3-hydroxy-phenyl)propionate/3-hydroxycinnamic acid hydroxylase [Rhodococcus sp. (in: high G+C Gram-positive bacteria)]
MTVDHYPVVVVGTGPTGMTAASLLGDYGIETLVLDRWDEVYPQPRAVHLDDEVYRILGQVGVADGFARISRPCLGLRLVDRDMRTLAEFGRDSAVGPHGYPQANMFDQPDLEGIMRSRMYELDSVEFRGGCEVVDVANQRDHVRIDYLDISTNERRCVTADYVLGCDGANSVVRRSIGSTLRELGFEQRWLVVDISIDADLGHWEGVHQICDTERAGTFMRIGISRYRWEFRLLGGESVETFADPEAVHALVAPWLTGIDGRDLTVLRHTEYTFRAEVVDNWRDRRIMLLGDAAHLTPPFIGQGMGAGLRDAANLAWKVAGVLSGVLSQDALDTYESERKPHATSMIKLAVAIGWAMTGGGPTSDMLRRRGMPLVEKASFVAATVTDSATPRLSKSAFVQRDWLNPRDRTGRLCPNAALEQGGRLDDVAPGRFLFVTTTPPTTGQRAEIERRGAAVVEVPLSSGLGEWLRRGRAVAAVVRPDRTVMATSRSVPSLHTRIPSFGPSFTADQQTGHS